MVIHPNIKHLFCRMDHTNARIMNPRGVWEGWDKNTLVANAYDLIIMLNTLTTNQYKVSGEDIVAKAEGGLHLVAAKSPDHVMRYKDTDTLMERICNSICQKANCPVRGWYLPMTASRVHVDGATIINFTSSDKEFESYTLQIANRDTRAGRNAGFPCDAHIDLLESQWDPVAYRFVPRDHGYAVEYKDVVPYAPIFELRFEHKKQKHVIECNQFGRPLTYDDVVLLSQFNPNTRPKGSCSPGFHSYELATHVVRSRVIRELNKMAEHFGATAGRFNDY